MRRVQSVALAAIAVAGLFVVAPPASAQAPECEAITSVGPPQAHVSPGSGFSTYPRPSTGACADVLVGVGPVQLTAWGAAGAGDALASKEVDAGTMVCFPTFCVLVGAHAWQNFNGSIDQQSGVCYIDNQQAFCIP
ncbi:MAG: hypothetical protein ABR613_00920 [Actinomycetota bacterium]